MCMKKKLGKSWTPISILQFKTPKVARPPPGDFSFLHFDYALSPGKYANNADKPFRRLAVPEHINYSLLAHAFLPALSSAQSVPELMPSRKL